jgi:hypothetical protein
MPSRRDADAFLSTRTIAASIAPLVVVMTRSWREHVQPTSSAIATTTTAIR